MTCQQERCRIGRTLMILAMIILAGCSHVSVSSKQYLGGPSYQPTNPVSVQILRSMPLRPMVRLGEVTAEPTGNPTAKQIEQKLRAAGAQMGADAVVIISDRTVLMGASIAGGFRDRQLQRDFQRVIVGIAIHYN